MNKLTNEVKKIEEVQKVRSTQRKKKKKNQKSILIKIIVLIYIVILIGIFIYSLLISNKFYKQEIELKNKIIDAQAKTIEIQTNYKAIEIVEDKVTSSDRELIARLVYLEARGESIECQRAVTSVIINRLNSGYWGDTIKKVIYAKNQFEPANQIKNTTPTQTQYDAVDYVLDNGITIPSWVLYFRASYHFNWQGYTKYAQMSNTFFGGYVKGE